MLIEIGSRFQLHSTDETTASQTEQHLQGITVGRCYNELRQRVTQNQLVLLTSLSLLNSKKAVF